MKHTLAIGLALALIAAALSPLSVFAAPQPQSKLPEVLAKIDASLDTVWPTILSKENSYVIVYRGARYWQALSTHAVLPEDGAEKKPDAIRTPTDQPDPWPASVLNADLPMAISVDIYDGPQGAGYVVNVTAVIDKRTWMRSINTGPEKWRDTEWRDVTPDEKAP